MIGAAGTEKPLYRVPLMTEINAMPKNGFKVVSTFSGCGGSCLGYRMAGFNVIWANEFVPIAQESYKANAAPDCILDGRDIRLVQAEEILAVTGLKVGELDLFDGSPPCQAFSTAGKREKGWGKDKTYEHGAKQRNEELFFEYIRLLEGLKPKTFIAENVSGLVKGVAKGFFLEILAKLKECGYRVETRVLDAQWLGVPQCRQRVIFVGVREDLCERHGVKPCHPSPLSYRYSVREACPWIGSALHDTTGKAGQDGINSYSAGEVADRSCPAITNGVAGLNSRHFSDAEMPGARVIHENGGYATTECLDTPMPTVGASANFRVFDENAEVGQFAAYRDHRGAFGNGGTITDQPAPAVLAGSVGTHWMRSDTTRRKFTIAELRRICSFPDDFILCGSYADQWARLGNSVPPLMMRAIAEVVRDKVLIPCARA